MEELTASQGGNSKEIEDKELQIRELKETIANSGDLFTEIRQEIEKSRKEREELNQRHKSFLRETGRTFETYV